MGRRMPAHGTGTRLLCTHHREGQPESLLLGLGSTMAGYLAGLGVAWWIGRRIFPDSAVGVNFSVFLPVAGVTLAVAALATLAAAARIWSVTPAVILRGE